MFLGMPARPPARRASPRVSAWHIASGSKTVARAGYGITVDPDNMRNQRNAFPSIINEDYTPPKSYQFISYAGVPNSDGATQVSLSDGLPLPTAPLFRRASLSRRPVPLQPLTCRASARSLFPPTWTVGTTRAGISPSSTNSLRPWLHKPHTWARMASTSWRASTSTGRLPGPATPAANSLRLSPAMQFRVRRAVAGHP